MTIIRKVLHEAESIALGLVECLMMMLELIVCVRLSWGDEWTDESTETGWLHNEVPPWHAAIGALVWVLWFPPMRICWNHLRTPHS